MCGMARAAMEHATKAMVEVDLSLAEQVITDDAGIQRVGEQCAEHACALLALQAPVARDLRTVVTAIQAAEKIGRMGELARHIAEIVRLRHPLPAAPAELIDTLAKMGGLAVVASQRVEESIAAPSGVLSAHSERADDESDRLHHEVVERVKHANPPYPVQVGVDVALLARFFERFADQAVGITRRLDYVVTGERPARPSA